MLMVDSSSTAPRRPKHPLLLREWRRYRKLTQEQLAECMETDKAVISELENGKKRWNADHLYKAAKCLGCKPYQLFTTDPNLDVPLEDLLQRVKPEDRERVRRVIEAFIANGDKN